MAEIPCDVFDIFCPSPVPLKELSAMAINLAMWRCEVYKYRRDCLLDEFYPSKLKISSKTVFPHLPSMIYKVIDEYVPRFGCSMNVWLKEHYSRVFRFHYSHQNDVLKDFDHFVCDYNGTIDYLKTAERMMQCDRFNVDKKFVVACTYFFEDDVRRFWPLVCEKIDLSVTQFWRSPHFYYWIYCLKNELDQLPATGYYDDDTANEIMLNHCMPSNRRSLEYFWDRVPSNKRIKIAEGILNNCEDLFTRVVLPKLNDNEINELINVRDWLGNQNYDEELILQLWTRFKHRINSSTFKDMVKRMLSDTATTDRELEYEVETDKSYIERIRKKWVYLGSEIWNSAPDNLKQSTIGDILFWSELFTTTDSEVHYPYDPRNVGILLAILPYATFEDRNEFWNLAWPKLIDRTRGKNLQRLIELCFQTQDEISQFKQNVLIKSNDVKKQCAVYLQRDRMEDANDLIYFCCPDMQTARIFKLELLQSVYLCSEALRRLKSNVFFHSISL